MQINDDSSGREHSAHFVVLAGAGSDVRGAWIPSTMCNHGCRHKRPKRYPGLTKNAYHTIQYYGKNVYYTIPYNSME